MSTTLEHNSSPQEGKAPGFWSRLYNGESNFQVVQNRRRWFLLMAVLFIACAAVIGIRGFSLGIDFQGGTRMSVPAVAAAEEDHVAEVFEGATGIAPQSTQTVGSGDAEAVEINSERLSEEQIRDARTALFEEFQPKDSSGEVSQAAISESTVSESWGSSITQRMLIALGVFLLVVFAYITIRLERDMAISAIICLLSDLIVVAGLYALIGFEVSPATVIGLLTILAYSLYDTVVVFDKVKENTSGLFANTRSTYEEEVNLAVNQTIMRSINTSIFSLVPIASLLVVAVGILGVGTLKDLALVQFIGVIAGTVSSILFAAPLLVAMKMRNKKYKAHHQRVMDARANRGKNVASATEGDTAEEAPAAKRTVSTPVLPQQERPSESGPAEHEGPLGDGQSWRPGM